MATVRMITLFLSVSLFLFPATTADGGQAPEAPEVLGCPIGDLQCFVACINGSSGGEFPCNPDPDVGVSVPTVDCSDCQWVIDLATQPEYGAQVGAAVLQCSGREGTPAEGTTILMVATGPPYTCILSVFEVDEVVMELFDEAIPTDAKIDPTEGPIHVGLYSGATCRFDDLTVTAYGLGHSGPVEFECPWIGSPIS